MTVTAVFCSKNDNPNNYLRFILTINTLSKYYDEVIYVDYGSEKPLHIECKDQIDKSGVIRAIEVPISFTESVHPEKINKFVEVYARNIGIRRATSDYIVSTNQDVLSEPPVNINNNTMYTVARRNVDIGLVNKLSITGPYYKFLLDNAEVFNKQPDAVNDKGEAIWDSGDVWSLVVSCGDYQIAHRVVWYSIRGFEESMIYRSYADTNIMRKAANTGYNISKLQHNVFHLDHPVNQSTSYINNDRHKYVTNFNSATQNADTWGFSNIVFKETVI